MRHGPMIFAWIGISITAGIALLLAMGFALWEHLRSGSVCREPRPEEMAAPVVVNGLRMSGHNQGGFCSECGRALPESGRCDCPPTYYTEYGGRYCPQHGQFVSVGSYCPFTHYYCHNDTPFVFGPGEENG